MWPHMGCRATHGTPPTAPMNSHSSSKRHRASFASSTSPVCGCQRHQLESLRRHVLLLQHVGAHRAGG
jgi:hypothetical protein